jgi:hypothetical protein
VSSVSLYEYFRYQDYPSRRGEPPGLKLAGQLKALLTEEGIAWQEQAARPWEACEHLVHYDDDDPNNWDCVTDSRCLTVISVGETDVGRGREILAKLRASLPEE